jgi:5-carboxymethyl-2-hydroxymuconic-semialdehyde dehydrogenase
MTDTTTAATPHVPADLPTSIRHYIDGEFVDSADGGTFDVLDPVTNRV